MIRRLPRSKNLTIYLCIIDVLLLAIGVGIVLQDVANSPTQLTHMKCAQFLSLDSHSQQAVTTKLRASAPALARQCEQSVPWTTLGEAAR